MLDQRNYESYPLFYLRWIARILGMASISVLFFFVMGEGLEFNKVEMKDWIGLLFFPIGLVAGLLICWKNEGLGAFISIFSILAFNLIYGLVFYGRPWQGWAFIVFAVPAFLFLAYWLLIPRKFTNVRHI